MLSSDMIQLMWIGLLETLYMTVVSTFVAYIIRFTRRSATLCN